MNLRRVILAISLLSLLVLPSPGAAQEQSRLTSLRTRVREDRPYRNRFLIASGLSVALALFGLYALTRPHESGPRPRSG